MTSLFIYFVSSVCLKEIFVSAVSVTTENPGIRVNNGNATFRISIALGSGEDFQKVKLLKNTTTVFEAPYYKPGSPPVDDGKFLATYASRGSTDYSFGKTNFFITLSQVRPDDEGEYTVEVSIVGGIARSFSNLVVDLLPGKPFISGAPSSVVGGAEPTVIKCIANLGKPQASMVWSRRNASTAYTDITENVTTAALNSTHSTSTLTVNLDRADNGVKFRCQVSNRQATLSTETDFINVTEPVPVSDDNVQVCRTYSDDCASLFNYTFNDEVSLTCEGVASSPPIPAPHEYKWYQNVIGSPVISGPNLSFTIAVSEIVYVCNASNIVRGVMHTVPKQVTIRATAKLTSRTPVDTTSSSDTTTKSTISDKTTDGTQPGGALTAGAIAGIAIGAVVFLIILIALTVYCVRKKKDTLKDDAKYMDEGTKNPGMDSPDEGYNTQPDVVAPDQLYAAVNKPKKNKPADPQDPRSKNVEGLVYADLALDDTPRSRKPIQAYELTGTEYAEIMRK